jgi:hypothetical protein
MEILRNFGLSKSLNAGFEVFTAVVLKNSIFGDAILYDLLKENRRFGGTFRLHPQGQRISKTRNQRKTDLLAACFLRIYALLQTDCFT